MRFGFGVRGRAEKRDAIILDSVHILNVRTTTSQKCAAVPRRACYSRLKDSAYHSTLGLRIIKKKKTVHILDSINGAIGHTGAESVSESECLCVCVCE